MPNNFIRYSGVLSAFFLIICIRFFENNLFYDPFLEFFKSDFQNKPLPSFDGFKLTINIFFRYFLNAILSILIIFLLFKNKNHVKVASFLYVFLFLILISVLAYLLFISKNPDYLTLFYVRRFLIQPLLILLLIPAFYFQKKARK
jgi:exosortase F-associated protein